MKSTFQLILTIILIFSVILNIQLYRGYNKLENKQNKSDNSIQFKWEGLESDIPQDGIRQLQLTTNENTVYLNPVDE